MNVMLDTGFLITLVDASRSNHQIANDYLETINANGHNILLSPLAIAEYSVKSDPQPLFEMGMFEIPDFNLRHALKAAQFRQHTDVNHGLRDALNTRAVIINDTQIIAQASVEDVDYILTEDKNSFCKTANKLREAGFTKCKVVPLSSGYKPELFTSMEQIEIPFPEEELLIQN